MGYEVDRPAVLCATYPWDNCSGSFNDGGLVVGLVVKVGKPGVWIPQILNRNFCRNEHARNGEEPWVSWHLYIVMLLGPSVFFLYKVDHIYSHHFLSSRTK